MKVKDYINDAQNGTNITIAERVFCEDRDDMNDVFVGTVGQIGRCKYMECDVDYFRIINGGIELNISKVVEK